jgi:LDH2 family malate/lactate/ureidoglycolate dehydrogenase
MRSVPAVRADDLNAFVRAVCDRVSVPDPDAELVATALVEADLRGVASHGCARLPAYARALAAGIVNPTPIPRRIRGGTATEVIDGDNGMGLVVGYRAMERAVELATQTGIGAVAVRNSNHTGMQAMHVTPATAARMIGYFASNTPAIMAPWCGIDPKLGSAPVTYGIPTRGEPLVLDMATAASNRGRIRLYAKSGRQLPPGWAIDAEGKATTDPNVALLGTVLPMAGHKGYGLAVVNEVLTSALTGAQLAADMPREFLKEGSRVLDSWRSGHLAVAIDIAAFAELDDFLDQVDGLIAHLRSSRTTSETDTILLPGEPELALRENQLADGIELSPAVLDSLDEIADEFALGRLAVSR